MPSGGVILPSGRWLPRASGRKQIPSGQLSSACRDYEAPHVRTPRETVRTLHTKKQKTEENLQKSVFLKSVSEHACIIY
jgi:hypothetical protein